MRKIFAANPRGALSPLQRVEAYSWSAGIEGTLTPAPNTSGLAIEQKLQLKGEAPTPGGSYAALLDAAFKLREALIAHMKLIGEGTSATTGESPVKGQWYVHVSYMEPTALTPDEANGAGSAISSPDDIVRSVWHYIQMNVDRFMRLYQLHYPQGELQTHRKEYSGFFSLPNVEEYRSVGYTGAELDSFILSLGPAFEQLRREKLREYNGYELLRRHRIAAFAAGK
jgi:hypothetical protein